MVLNVTNVQIKSIKIYILVQKCKIKFMTMLSAFSQWQKKQILDPVLHINKYADFIAQIRCEGLRAQILSLKKITERKYLKYNANVGLMSFGSYSRTHLTRLNNYKALTYLFSLSCPSNSESLSIFSWTLSVIISLNQSCAVRWLILKQLFNKLNHRCKISSVVLLNTCTVTHHISKGEMIVNIFRFS